ncbi:hypothetical protein CIPAW_09G084000 [Carya illinoinensis]|uniref:Uncharacterized protein n=1 Tax=Carya illinoinensis TaxID=32201 RepID=A0A8T1PBT2_CARIL|nr:hypothetical protein CIPAW_09G084000 [Carya illinoinensis]
MKSSQTGSPLYLLIQVQSQCIRVKWVQFVPNVTTRKQNPSPSLPITTYRKTADNCLHQTPAAIAARQVRRALYKAVQILRLGKFRLIGSKFFVSDWKVRGPTCQVSQLHAYQPVISMNR